ncbi:hypothetical protein BJX66DRAFT_171585 [Aspergillus keveii]|uniref:Uncharacterized protein n=1 Tax=Aspergillus keveii TaxID=714993 RepID=A0ABR4G8F5_9EURO
MFFAASRCFPSLYRTRSAWSSRYFHRVTTDSVHHDANGNLVTRKVPGIVGFPGEAYVLIDPEVGVALHAGSPLASTSAASADDKCQLTFFHESKYFGFGA